MCSRQIHIRRYEQCLLLVIFLEALRIITYILIIICSNLCKICCIVRSSLIKLLCLKIHFTEDNVNRYKAEDSQHLLALSPVGLTNVWSSIVRNLIACILLKVWSKLSYDTINVELWIVTAINLRDCSKRFCKEWNLTIGASQLQVSPSTESLDSSILTHSNECTTCHKGCITMCDVVVTVVDYTIVYVCRIIFV